MHFIRKGGRVIPIRDSNEVKGAAMAAGGVGIAYATGKTAAKLMHESAHAENEAHNLGAVYKNIRAVKSDGPLFRSIENQRAIAVGRNALRHAVKSKDLERASFHLRHIGTVASAGLIGMGVNKAMESHPTLKKDKKTRAAIAGGSGVAATFAIRSSYLRGVGMRGFDVLKHAARRAFLKI